MGKYFGTDGFRGEASVDLTADHAYKIGRILGHLASERAEGDAHARIVIGMDTRHSGAMFESALAAGITASGADACLLGVVTTPGVSYLTRMGDYAFGVMVSASHNPFYDNGIKVLNENGEKLDEATENAIEAYIDGEPAELPFATRNAIGITIDASASVADYAEFLKSCAPSSLAGYRIGLDCANGSASAIAPAIFEALGAEVHAISTEPDGFNINVDCGSTHLKALGDFVLNNDLDLGFAYDGDADRCLAVDDFGKPIDGDQLMYMSALYLKGQDRLANDTVVTTIMSNYGLYKALDAAGLTYEKTAVGDKYVYENMAANGHVLGGEQSGHIIFREFATTGDGILTSLMVMEAIVASGKTIKELIEPLEIYPQVLRNVRVTIDKHEVLKDPDIVRSVEESNEQLEGYGRMLARPSGTEPVVRLMCESTNISICERYIQMVVDNMRAKGFVAEDD